MSYILDALRKSDQQRHRGVPPPLLALQATAVVPGRRVSISQVVLAALLIGAGIVIGSLRPWKTEQPTAATQPAAMKPLESSQLLSSPVPVPAQPQMARKPEHDIPAQKTASAARTTPAPTAATMERQVPAVAKREARAKPRNKPREAVTAVPQELTGKPVPENPDGAGRGDAAQEQKVMTIAELPVSIQQEIPKMSISVHAYSGAPKERLVGINDRMLREGDFLVPGLLLEQITLNGVIMSYKGYRFRRGVR